jgi:protein-tyrosine phosphatase
MRSPIAEALFRKFTEQQRMVVTVASAGLHAIDGTVADPRACSSASEFGISLTKHRARLLTAEMMSQADVVFIMDFQNQAELKARYPFFEEKVRSLAIFADQHVAGREIPDPYYGDTAATRNCCAVLDNCVRNLVEKLDPTRSNCALKPDRGSST